MINEKVEKRDKLIHNESSLPFIMTSDKETMLMLEKRGFQFFDYSNGTWTFLNCQNIKHNFDNNKNIVYSNMLYV